MSIILLELVSHATHILIVFHSKWCDWLSKGHAWRIKHDGYGYETVSLDKYILHQSHDNVGPDFCVIMFYNLIAVTYWMKCDCNHANMSTRLHHKGPITKLAIFHKRELVIITLISIPCCIARMHHFCDRAIFVHYFTSQWQILRWYQCLADQKPQDCSNQRCPFHWPSKL